MPLRSVDMASAATSAAAALGSYLVDHLSLALLGVDLSTLLIGFSGVMLAVALVPKNSYPWWRAILSTGGYLIASIVLPTLVLDLSHLRQADGKAITFLLGFGFPVIVFFVYANRVRVKEAVFSWIERRSR